MNLYDDKSKIIRKFEKGDTKSISFPYNGLGLEPEPKLPTKCIREKLKLKGRTKFIDSAAERKNQAGTKLYVDLSMGFFLKNINSIYDTHGLSKEVNKCKLKFKTKAWITLSLQKFISIKTNLLKKIITSSDPQVKERHHKE